jgi:hypothetical protein
MVLGKRILDNKEMTWSYIRGAAMERRSPPQCLNISTLPAFSGLKNGFVPLLYFRTTTATLRIEVFTSKEQKRCSCSVRI